ncbi:MAG TPA: efflux RND transporter periplasmic adaptor subunit [Pyrinomonadaceae bacterium]|nr:efflux RND transporter periplasmic adaptor subunit [Chloracidobacterium sp.]MBP9935928.1 efflux RND transporter periplasmic adaptor subunit [Pyrinomonadaceae bacterium]MBK9436417.1 efflux RND transporter periplasmic adaptor subunit [Chloracidobacterium sp.]MBL0241398.1 efflux RND transporter periplasmic adaptor subunit [Chloracidobacterium sp.]HQX54554.1 efflux RND transporter periplasmic adaptor subunit [Pyrinomonadaceae bacterium]
MSDPESKLDKTESNEDLKNQLPRSRKKGFRIVAVLLLLGLVGVSIWYFILRHPPIPSNLIEVSGRIETDDARVSSKTSGRIREINVSEGSSVKAGQVIAVLDDAQLVAREEQAQAIVDQSETRITRARQQIAILEEQLRQSQIGVDQAKLDSQGRVNQAEAQISQANSQIAQAEAQLAQAEVNLKQAKYDEEKSLRLYKTGDVPEKQAIQAQTNAEAHAKVVQAQRKQVESARAGLKAAQGTLTVARANLANPSLRASQSAAILKQINQAQSDIDAAQADSERARAQLREAQANRADLNIIAPFDGTVATRSAEPGEVVAPGAAIVTLINPNLIYLRAFVPEGKIGLVKIGQAVRVYLDSNPNQPLEAEVTMIDMEAAFTPENTYFRDERVKQVVGVKLSLKNPGGFAKPGMPADGVILIQGEWSDNIRYGQ